MTTPHAIANELRKSLPNTFAVEPTPEHPHLLAGPDLLVGGEGRLTAIFLLTPDLDPEGLWIRLIAARLALPTLTRMVAIGANDASFAPVARDHFDCVIQAHPGVFSLAEVIQSDLKPKVNAIDLQQAKRLHAIRWSACSLITQLRYQRAMRQKTIDPIAAPLTSVPAYAIRPGSVPISSSPTASEPSNDFHRGHHLRQHRGMAKEFRWAWHHGLRHGFDLVEGTPHARHPIQPLLLLTTQWPALTREGDQQVRSMAFSGWIMATPESEEDVNRLFARAQTYMDKKRRVGT